VVGAAGLEPTTPGFGGHRRRSVAIRSGAKHMKFIGFVATSLTHRAESNRLITHLGIRRVYGFGVVSLHDETVFGRSSSNCDAKPTTVSGRSASGHSITASRAADYAVTAF